MKPIRLQKGWTQEETAQRTGYSQRMISHYETNEEKMSSDAQYTISRAFGVPMESLYEWIEINRRSE